MDQSLNNRSQNAAASAEGYGPSREEILPRLIDLLTDLTSDCDRGFSGGIGRETRLVADLEFDSVDVVQFALLIEERFRRRKLPFEKLLMADGRYRDDVTVGEVAEFLVVCLAPRA
jgi:acyl carrier protein